MRNVTIVVQAAGYCKRAPVSIKQVQTYLKKVKLYKNAEVQHLTDENMVDEFTRLVKARPTKVIDGMVARDVKPKRKRKRIDKITERKKPRLQLIKSDDMDVEQGKGIKVKTESVHLKPLIK